MRSTYTDQDYEGLAFQILSGSVNMLPTVRGRFFLQLSAALLEFHDFLRTEDDQQGRRLMATMDDLLAQARTLSQPNQQSMQYLETAIQELSFLRCTGPIERTAWACSEVSARTRSVPGMLYRDSMKYYKWLGSCISGVGEVVELGCWMGSSTCALAEGLAINQRFRHRRIHAFDSFIWENWMDPYREQFNLPLAVRTGDSYLEMFLKFCAPYSELLEPHPGYVVSGPAGEAHIPAAWAGNQVELFLYDMGSIYEQITSVWNTFSKYFIAGRTFVVFNEYGKLRSEDIWRFCREHAEQLRPVHKPIGSTKGFLFAA
jgi:hypothetical protein